MVPVPVRCTPEYARRRSIGGGKGRRETTGNSQTQTREAAHAFVDACVPWVASRAFSGRRTRLDDSSPSTDGMPSPLVSLADCADQSHAAGLFRGAVVTCTFVPRWAAGGFVRSIG